MNELVSLNDSQDFSELIKTGSEQELQKLLGSADFTSESKLARLSINYSAEDNDDNPLPRGHYRLYDPESRNTVFAKDVKFRPFVRTYMYNVWDNEENQFSCRTVQCKSMGDPFHDTSGGEKCGRMSKEEQNALPNDSAVLTQQKNIKCVQVIYGLVTIEGKNATKEDYTLENVPAVWYVKGASFIPISDWFKSIDKEKKLYATTVGKLEAIKQKRGGIQFWISRATTVETKDFSKKDRVVLESFIGDIMEHNSEIMEKHRESKKAQPAEAHDAIVEALEMTA